jgi:hypothetical protein
MSVRQLVSRVVPICFVVGAGVETFMLTVDINGTNFYGTALRKAAERRDEELLQRVEYLESQGARRGAAEARRKAALAYANGR